MECLVNMEQMLRKKQLNWYISLVDPSHIGKEIEHIYYVWGLEKDRWQMKDKKNYKDYGSVHS